MGVACEGRNKTHLSEVRVKRLIQIIDTRGGVGPVLGCDERTHVDCWVSVLFQVSANLWLTSNRQDPSTRLTSGHSLANADQLIHLPKRRHGCRTSRTTITPAGSTLKLGSLILYINVESQILFLRYESK